MKKFIFYFILFFKLTAISYAEVIKEINVIGNSRITKESIIVFGNINKNENYDSRKLNNILKNLYQTEFFSDVKLNFKNNVLTVNVSENPIIQNVIFEGIKAEKFKDVIYEIIVLKEKTSFTNNRFNKDINNIKNAFRNSGYYFVKVDGYKKVLDNNIIDLIYEINLGKKAKKIFSTKQKGDVKNTWADIKKANKILNYKPKISPKEGVTKFIEWYKQYYKKV